MNGDTGTQQAPDGANWQFKQEGSSSASPVVSPTIPPAPNQLPVTPADPGVQQPIPSPLPQPERPPIQPTEIIAAELPPAANAPEISWTASEFADHEKSPAWYIGLTVVTIIIAIVTHLLTKDIFSLIAIVAFAITFGIIGSYKPKIVSYHLGPDGIQINHRTHAFAQFKSYGVQSEGVFPSIVFMPMKRFMPPTVVYFPPEEGDELLAVLSQYLPAGAIPQDPIDRALRHVRF